MHKSVAVLLALLCWAFCVPNHAIRFDRNSFKVDVLSMTTSAPVPIPVPNEANQEAHGASTPSTQLSQSSKAPDLESPTNSLAQTAPKFREMMSLDVLKSELNLQFPDLNVKSNPFGCQMIIQPTCSKPTENSEDSIRECTIADDIEAMARELLLQAERSEQERVSLHQKAECMHKTIEEYFRQMSNIEFVAALFRDKYKDLLHQRRLVVTALRNARMNLKDLEDKDKAEIRNLLLADEEASERLEEIEKAIEAATQQDHHRQITQAQVDAEKLRELSLASAAKLEQEVQEQKMKDRFFTVSNNPVLELSEAEPNPPIPPTPPRPQLPPQPVSTPPSQPLVITDAVKAKEIIPTQKPSTQPMSDVKIVSRLAPTPSQSTRGSESSASHPPPKIVIQIAGQGTVEQTKH